MELQTVRYFIEEFDALVMGTKGTARDVPRTLHIATVGKSAEPILEGLRALPADDVTLLHSIETKETATSIVAKYASFARGAKVHMREVNQLDFESTLVASLVVAGEHPEHRVVINITGGTKIMAPAALLAAFILGAEAVYIKEDKTGTLPLAQRVLDLPIPRVNISALTSTHRDILVQLERYEHEGRSLASTSREFLKMTLGKKGPTLTYHLRKLETHRLIEQTREGREQRVTLTPSGRLYARLIASSKVAQKGARPRRSAR